MAHFVWFQRLVTRLQEEMEKALLLPTEKQARDSFVHAPDCAAEPYYDHIRLVDNGLTWLDHDLEHVSNLEVVERQVFVPSGSMWVSGFTIPVQTLRCTQCGALRNFRPNA